MYGIVVLLIKSIVFAAPKLIALLNVVKTLIEVLLFFFCFFFSEKVLKVSNNYRCAFMHIDAFVNTLRYICSFEFN